MKNKDFSPVLFNKMLGEAPPDDFESDGCTGFPDNRLSVACHFHDYAYILGGNEEDRKIADKRFYKNLIMCNCIPIVSLAMYRRVRFWGISHFSYKPPLSFWQKLKLYLKCLIRR